MPRGKPLSSDYCRGLYRLSFKMPVKQLAEKSGESITTIYRIIRKGNAGLDFAAKPRGPRGSYVLSEADIQVRCCFQMKMMHFFISVVGSISLC